MHELNKLGFIPLFLVLVGAFSVALLIRKRKKTVDCTLTQDEHKRYLEESIAIQPSNSLMFPNRRIGEVIASGLGMLKQDNYNILEGDIDV